MAKKTKAREGEETGRSSPRSRRPGRRPPAKAKAKPPGRPKPPAKAKHAPKGEGAGRRPRPRRRQGEARAEGQGLRAGEAAPRQGQGGGGRQARLVAPGRAASPRGGPSLLRRGPDGEILAPGRPPAARRRPAHRGDPVPLPRLHGRRAPDRRGGDRRGPREADRRPRPRATARSSRKILAWARERFDHGTIEPAIPPRPNLRRTFQGVVERAKQRRREIGAFLRGLDLGHTETSHMDAHGEASLHEPDEAGGRPREPGRGRGAGPDRRQRVPPRSSSSSRRRPRR